MLFYPTWLYYPSTHNGWFDTNFRNSLLLVSSIFRVCLILVTLSFQYHCASTFHDIILLLLFKIVFYLSLQLLMIFFYLSLCLINITLPILVATIFSSLPYHFAYPCYDCLLLINIFFYLYWLLCFSFLQS